MSNIPYILEERPDTGMNNSKLGIWIFIASEIMLFGGLFSAYVFLRIAAPEGDFDYWGSKLSVPMATFNTLVLITSSVTMVMSWASLKMQQFDKYKMYLGITILCGLAFLVVKYFEYQAKFEGYPIMDDMGKVLYSAPWQKHNFYAVYFSSVASSRIKTLFGMSSYFETATCNLESAVPLQVTSKTSERLCHSFISSYLQTTQYFSFPSLVLSS